MDCIWEYVEGVIIANGFGVVEVENRRLMIVDCRRDENCVFSLVNIISDFEVFESLKMH